MEQIKKSICFLVVPLIIAMGISLTSYAQEKSILQQDRNATMKILARSMGQLKNASNVTDMKSPADTIVTATKKLFDLWPKGSGGGLTRAKDEIWLNMSDFESKLNDMKKAADKLVSTLDGTNIGTAKSAFISVGRTCGACHKIYRGPKL